MTSNENAKPEAKKPLILRTDLNHLGNYVTYFYNGYGAKSSESTGRYEGAYVSITISISHIDPREVQKVRNMLEAKILEVNEQFAADKAKLVESPNAS